MMCRRFLLSTHCQRGCREECFHLQKRVSISSFFFFCHSLSYFNTHTRMHTHIHTHTQMLKYPRSFSHNSLFCLSVCISEGILHPSNSPPGSFILRLGPAHIPCQRLSILLNIKSSVSRLALSSPCSVPCIFRSRRPRYKAG